MLLDEERYVVQWLSQYGALQKTQVIRMLNKPKRTAEKILQNLHKQLMIADLAGGYFIGLDNLCQPDYRMITAVWVLTEFIDKINPLSHYPATYPAQLFFLKDNTGYEVLVIREGENDLLRFLKPEEDLKYIIVLPNVQLFSELKLPKGNFIFATVDFKGKSEPEVSFFAEVKNEKE